MTEDWRKELDDILLDVCEDEDCATPFEHKDLKFVVRDRLLTLLTTRTEQAVAEEREKIVGLCGDFRNEEGKTVRYFLLPHTEHLPGDDGEIKRWW